MAKNRIQKTIALAGNPNVGKSTLFNALTGMKQHTGNWTGKTVESAEGIYRGMYKIVDLPGTYSLFSHSHEEKLARDYIISGEADVCCVVCDAACLERNLTLVLQIFEISSDVIIVLNLWDEVEKYGISIDTSMLSQILHVPVICSSAKRKSGLAILGDAFDGELGCGYTVKYDSDIEYALTLIDEKYTRGEKLRIISTEEICRDEFIHAYEYLWAIGYYPEKCEELIAQRISDSAHDIAERVVRQNEKRMEHTRRIDKILTGKYTAVPIMLLMLLGILYITVVGANYPSAALSKLFGWIEEWLNKAFISFLAPDFIRELLVFGIWRVMSWVVAVMLPPMAIFFPLFTLLEDSGFLPRIAFNMDGAFCKACSCGKQSLTMCMGFGCNAVGVCGARIIDSPRERLIAILTNVFVPCNGRFPMIISLISVFFVSWLAAPILAVVILFGIAVTLCVSYILSKSLLRGIPSAFTLELPPYRLPNLGKVLIRSFIDRTLFVLGRAVSVAAPAGAVIWLATNLKISGVSIFTHVQNFLDPIVVFFGLDGVILLAFIMGLPANEIVLPLIIIGYTGGNVLTEAGDLIRLKELLVSNGWDLLKCISVLVFCICHFPCSTTLLTVKKETGSIKWTVVAALLPTAVGLLICFLLNCFC